MPSSHTVQLNVPTGVHPVFHVDLIRPAATDPLPSQIVDDSQPPPVLVDNEEEYEVEEVLDIRTKHQGRRAYQEALVKWAGYAETTWEKLDNLRECAALDTYEQHFGQIPSLHGTRLPSVRTGRASYFQPRWIGDIMN